MLLTVATTHRPATDLGYLLHKHPDKLQSVDLSFGAARVYYPEATEARCTATPTIETATKLARALDVSLDYLTALTDHVADPDARARLEAITALPDEDRRFVLRAQDSLVRDTRIQKAYAA